MSKIAKLPAYVYLYFFCQSLNLMAAVISVVVAAAVGNKIASNDLYATVPYGMQFLFLLLGTYPAAAVMDKYGRKFGFTLGAVFLFLAGVIGYLAISGQSFTLLILSHGCIGLFGACANFYRFAVTDSLPASLQSKALSLVVAGGIFAGILGPLLSSQLRDIAGFPEFSLCYAVLMLLAVANLGLIYFLPNPSKASTSPQSTTAEVNLNKQGLAIAKDYLFVAIFVAAVGYGLMNLLMIQSSLKMNHMHIPFGDTAFAIQWHVVAMFFPSFFTGVLIARFGHMPIIVSGFTLFIASFLINMQAIAYFNIALSLILLGLGWNFTYVGGSALLALILKDNLARKRWQGIGDTVIALFSTLGAMLPSFLLGAVGWENSNIIAIVICIFPLLGLLWLYRGRLVAAK